MLGILPEPGATAVAVAVFTGARKGKIRGLLWEDYDGFSIRVKQAVWRKWRSHVDEPKRRRLLLVSRQSIHRYRLPPTMSAGTNPKRADDGHNRPI